VKKPTAKKPSTAKLEDASDPKPAAPFWNRWTFHVLVGGSRDALLNWRSGALVAYLRKDMSRPQATIVALISAPRAQASLAIGSHPLAKLRGLACANTRKSSEHSA
jgi:hypothetical protein